MDNTGVYILDRHGHGLYQTIIQIKSYALFENH